MAGIYLHIPYCRKACYYCDFHFSTTLRSIDDMVKAMIKEIELRKGFLENQTVETIYLGGGTPSVLIKDQLRSLLQKVNNSFNVLSNAEITLEANPEDINNDYAKELHELGFNRISLGVQSFNDKILESLNRIHNRKKAEEAIVTLQQVGFDNITIDLIYGIPGQDHETWIQNLETAIKYQIPHLSCYALTIEEHTVWGNWLQKGKMNPIPDKKYEKEYQSMCNLLRNSSYTHYEISNFALSGFESKHNQAYWQRKPYLGIGPGAHSFNLNSRYNNLGNNAKYIKALEDNILPLETETLSNRDQYNEYLLTGLRTNMGIDFDYIKSQYGIDMVKEHKDFINKCISDGRACISNGRFILNEETYLIANSIIVELMVD